jgi:hypothetical protein
MAELTCQHCENPITGKIYRVTNEEGGVLTLEMIVCEPCSEQALSLGLKIEELDAAARRFLQHDS